MTYRRTARARHVCDSGWGTQMLMSAAKSVSLLTSGRLLARNTIWNLIGNGAPIIVAAFGIPILIHGLGGVGWGQLGPSNKSEAR
jgi:hypothetical protein